MPWAIPPCCWPVTSSGFSTRPQSSTATWRTGRTRPVSVSTSTTARWAPKGNVAPGGDSGHAEAPVLRQDDVTLGRLQQPGGEGPAGGEDRFGRPGHGAATQL